MIIVAAKKVFSGKCRLKLKTLECGGVYRLICS